MRLALFADMLPMVVGGVLQIPTLRHGPWPYPAHRLSFGAVAIVK